MKAGDLLATVSSVETDQQYEAALRDLENKKRNWDRAKDLVAHGWTSRQAADQARDRLHHGDGQRGAERDDEIL